MKKLLLSASLIALSIGAVFSQTNSITAGNRPSSSNKGYYFSFNGGPVDNCLGSNGVAYYGQTIETWTIPGTGDLQINVPTQTSYTNFSPQLANFYSGNCVSSPIDLSSNANHKFTISLNSSPASTSTTTSRQLVVIFYQGSNSTYATTALLYTITPGSNLITSDSQGQKFSFGASSNIDSTQISAIGLLIRGWNGTAGWGNYDAAGTYNIDYIAIGDTAVLGGTSTNTTTGITSQEIALANQVSIYPNPATDNITVDLSLFPGGADVKILNSNGATVAEQNAQGSATFPVGNLTKGLYFIQISSDNLVVQKKFIHD